MTTRSLLRPEWKINSLLVLISVLYLTNLTPACATTGSGMDTQGQTDLPLAVEGYVGFDLLKPSTTPTVAPGSAANTPNGIFFGYVGIGTTIPATPLDVQGVARIFHAVTQGGTIQLVGDNTQNIFLENINGLFSVGNTSGLNDIFHIDQSGNVVSLGNIKPGAPQGASCSPEGAIAYDPVAHGPVYCNSALAWVPLGGGSPSGTLCGSFVNPNCGGSGNGSQVFGTTVLCQGYNPITSCPAGYTSTQYSSVASSGRVTACLWSCIKN